MEYNSAYLLFVHLSNVETFAVCFRHALDNIICILTSDLCLTVKEREEYVIDCVIIYSKARTQAYPYSILTD